jgi:hypothetical protein
MYASLPPRIASTLNDFVFWLSNEDKLVALERCKPTMSYQYLVSNVYESVVHSTSLILLASVLYLS